MVEVVPMTTMRAEERFHHSVMEVERALTFPEQFKEKQWSTPSHLA